MTRNRCPLIALLVVAALTISVTGCGKDKEDLVTRSEIESALGKTGLDITSHSIAPTEKSTASDVIAGTATDRAGDRIRFVWAVWPSSEALAKQSGLAQLWAASVPEAKTRIVYRNVMFVADSGTGKSKRMAGRGAYKVQRMIGSDLLRQVSDYEPRF